jgi:hypothetical protein
MLRFILSTIYLAALLPLYLLWSRQQIEAQLDKMQAAVFNSPGVESPITPAIVVGGITLLTSHVVIARRGLQLSLNAALASLLVGGALGYLGWRQWAKEGQ